MLLATVSTAIAAEFPRESRLSASKLAKAKQLFEKAVKGGNIKGAVLLVAKDGKIVFHEAVGWRNEAKKLPMRRDTLIRMASNTKAVVATAVMLLAEEGKLSVDDPIGKHLPAFQNEKCRDIRIRHLLSHTSGLRIKTLFLSPMMKPSKEHPDAPTLQLEVDRFADVGPTEKPGTTFSYNNPGYNTLGALVEKVSGKPLETFLNERIYKVLGMNETTNHPVPEKHARMSVVYERLKSGKWKIRFRQNSGMRVPFVRASGGMVSTAEDYLRFCQMFLDKGRVGNRRLLSEESIVAMTTPQNRQAFTPEQLKKSPRLYGYGWFIYEKGRFGHTGSEGTFAWIDPKRRIVGMVLTQSPKGKTPRQQFINLVFRLLVAGNRALSFLPATEPPKPAEEPETEAFPADSDNGDAPQLAQPEDEDPVAEGSEDAGPAERHTDKRLQTELVSEKLQRRLLKLFYDARTFEEEQGVNILYLALGFLKWQEADESHRDRFAPLLLVPVTLERRSAGSRFRLRYTGEDITTNLSLQAKLKVDFGITLPEVPDGSGVDGSGVDGTESNGSDPDDLSPDAYFESVRQAIAEQPGWEVLPNDIVLWFFSFSRFLMYRDLQPETWPEDRPIDGRTLVDAILGRGFPSDEELFPDDVHIDDILQPADMIHVMDADSSQTLAIEDVKRDRNLVIQGPPGTGKSQTITNLIATVVHSGKTVLFVAEKMAALEVVKRRLDSIGLGDLCLELHSHKSNKRAVLDELGKTLELGPPTIDGVEKQAADLKLERDRLNDHARSMHTPLSPAGKTPFQILGELVRLRAAGVPLPDFELVEPLLWSEVDVDAKRTLLEDLSLHLKEVGRCNEHPWRGVRVEAMLPMDIERMIAALPEKIRRFERLIAVRDELAELLEVSEIKTARETAELATLSEQLTAAPPMDRAAIVDDVWDQYTADIERILHEGDILQSARDALRDDVADVAWTTDVAAARSGFAAKGDSLLRFFSPAFWKARSTLLGILKGKPPTTSYERVALLDELIRGQNAAKKLADPTFDQIARRAFGLSWRGADSDWSALRRIVDWVAESRQKNLPGQFRKLAGRIALDELERLRKRLADDLEPVFEATQTLFASLQLDVSAAFASADELGVAFEALRTRFEMWREQQETLTQWIGYYHRRRRLEAEGLEGLGSVIDQGEIDADEILDRFDMAYHEELMREVFRQNSDLAGFNGTSHEKTLERFRELDVERIRLARQEVAAAHFERIPKGSGSVGELGIVRHEVQKKRRIKPIRRLLKEAGNAVQAIKPVFMMSPISIAQFLEPGVLDFDLLIVDEASQVRPVEALGALARCERAVVVGDDKQLPPTSFFSRVAGDEESDDDDFPAGDLESILGLCNVQGMPQRMLRWHYRSRHHSLIDVSNREFYDERLFVIPSPEAVSDDLGLRFHPVADGVFDRGGSATNRVEARAVADAVLEHARRFPGKTLGVGTFSVRQRDAILDEIELRRREHSELESFFTTDSAEPFFVKNLENIQGDERDVIFISVGYGKDDSGFMSMNFGPLSMEGGERRLNVLISRARERCEVFASITADDIDLHRAKSRGARIFKTFLRYAQSGHFDVGETTGRPFGSEFEKQVADAVAGLGYQLDAQVGTAGFYVDLAVIDPDNPGRYLLGIECDGAGYHSSRSARDRDRIRQSVLESRGWVIHRVWSTDWFQRPDEQLRQIAAGIERAKAEWSSRSRPAASATELPATTAPAFDAIRRSDRPDDDDDEEISSADPYIEAKFDVDTSRDVGDLDAAELAEVIAKIVAVESPVHSEIVACRVTALWDLSRRGRRVSEAVDEAITEAARIGSVVVDEGFLALPDGSAVNVRNRADVTTSLLRKPEMLPPAEIRSAVDTVIRTHLGASHDDAVVETARMLGFRVTSPQLRDTIEKEIAAMRSAGALIDRNGTLYVSDQ
eukprot:g26689.t1